MTSPPATDLLAACWEVGTANGITIVAPAPSVRPSEPSGDPLAEIARASGVRLRRVALTGAWWTYDLGPLLGSTLDGRPVALIPDGGRGYRLGSAVGGSAVRVTSEVAATLRPEATELVRGLPSGVSTLRDLLAFGLAGGRRDTLALLLASLLAGLGWLVVPLGLGWVVAEAETTATAPVLGAAVAATALAALLVAALTASADVALVRLSLGARAAISAAVWDRLLRAPVPFILGFDAADLARRAGAVDVVEDASGGHAGAWPGLVAAIPSLGLLWVLDPPLGLGVTLVLAAGLGLMTLVGRRLAEASWVFMEASGRLAGITQALISGVPKLRVAAAERRALVMWHREAAPQDAALRSAQRWSTALRLVSGGVAVGLVGAAGAAAVLGSPAMASPAAATMTLVIVGRLMVAMLALEPAVSALARVGPCLRRLRPILAIPPETPLGGATGRVHPGRLEGAIVVADLSFAYRDGDPPAVDRVSFAIEPGQLVGVVGRSGAGKSTLLRLLLGFASPNSGRILLDGRDLTTLEPDALRRQLGVVLQDAGLPAGDIGSAILGTSGLTLDEAWEAARVVGLDAELERMPMGLHSLVAEGGVNLSAGQRQRIVLARALVRMPRMLLLDEATSALDDATQQLVTERIRGLAITRVVTARRVRTVADADLVLVMDHGRIVQQGTYDVLIAQPGRFRDLAGLQLR